MNPVLNYTTIIQARRKLEELATARQRQETTLAALTAEYHTITGTAEKVLAQAEHQAHQQLTTARNNAGLLGGVVVGEGLGCGVVGVIEAAGTKASPSPAEVTAAIPPLIQNSEMSAAIGRSAADEESVRERLALATRAFE